VDMLTDDVGRHSRAVFPWHSVLPFLHITAERRTPSGAEFDDHSGNFFTLDFVLRNFCSVGITNVMQEIYAIS